VLFSLELARPDVTVRGHVVDAQLFRRLGERESRMPASLHRLGIDIGWSVHLVTAQLGKI
jgi:hypothetical protein